MKNLMKIVRSDAFPPVVFVIVFAMFAVLPFYVAAGIAVAGGIVLLMAIDRNSSGARNVLDGLMVVFFVFGGSWLYDTLKLNGVTIVVVVMAIYVFIRRWIPTD